VTTVESQAGTAIRPFRAPPPVTVPAALPTFPGEAFAASRSWAEQAYPTLSYYNRVDRGGHFAAWEEPDLFATELRAAFRPLRPSRIPEPR
jgi:pimeloyl-ACP methyl ester carboxylesterase